jgi:uncharacterized protein (DUF58 family)
MLVVALATRQAPLALLGAGLLLASASVWLWERYGLRDVTYTRAMGERRAFFGEEVPLVVEVVNRKLLPLPWLEAHDSIPAGVEVLGGPALVAGEPGRTLLRQLLSLRWYERVRLRYRLRCAARGAFTLGPVRLRSGDPFGFAGREVVLPVFDRLLVYPRVVPIEQLGLPSRHPFGEGPDPRRLFEDPIRNAGVRPYQPQDSPRNIHWKASARLQQLQTRIHEPTTSHTLMLYLNLATFEGLWWAALNRDVLELAVLAAASVALWALEQGYQVGMTTNGAPAGGGDELSLPPASDPQHQVRILDLLARVSAFARTPLETMLWRDRTRLPWGTTVVVVSAVLPETVLKALLSLEVMGHTAAALGVGGLRPAQVPGITIYHLPESLHWSTVPSLAPAAATP